jgi:hypothetical protein
MYINNIHFVYNDVDSMRGASILSGSILAFACVGPACSSAHQYPIHILRHPIPVRTPSTQSAIMSSSPATEPEVNALSRISARLRVAPKPKPSVYVQGVGMVPVSGMFGVLSTLTESIVVLKKTKTQIPDAHNMLAVCPCGIVAIARKPSGETNVSIHSVWQHGMMLANQTPLFFKEGNHITLDVPLESAVYRQSDLAHTPYVSFASLNNAMIISHHQAGKKLCFSKLPNGWYAMCRHNMYTGFECLWYIIYIVIESICINSVLYIFIHFDTCPNAGVTERFQPSGNGPIITNHWSMYPSRYHGVRYGAPQTFKARSRPLLCANSTPSVQSPST